MERLRVFHNRFSCGKYSMKTRIRLLAILFMIWLPALAGCSNEAEDFIQGKWARGDVHYWDEWNFDRGYYSHSYDDTHSQVFESGRYRIIDHGDDFISLELYDPQAGQRSIEDSNEINITFDKETDTAKIRRGEYTRVIASSLENLSTQQAP